MDEVEILKGDMNMKKNEIKFSPLVSDTNIITFPREETGEKAQVPEPEVSVSDDEARKKRLTAYAEKIKALQEDKK